MPPPTTTTGKFLMDNTTGLLRAHGASLMALLPSDLEILHHPSSKTDVEQLDRTSKVLHALSCFRSSSTPRLELPLNHRIALFTLLSLSLSLSLSLPCARFLDGRVNAHFIQAVSLRGMMSKATKPRPSIAIAGAHGVSNARRTR